MQHHHATVGDTTPQVRTCLAVPDRLLPASSQYKRHGMRARGTSAPAPLLPFAFTFHKTASRLVFFFFSPHSLLFLLLFNVLEMFTFARMITSILAALTLASVSSVLAAAIGHASKCSSTAAVKRPAVEFVARLVLVSSFFLNRVPLPISLEMILAVCCNLPCRALMFFIYFDSLNPIDITLAHSG